jgi:hypothetical protein
MLERRILGELDGLWEIHPHKDPHISQPSAPRAGNATHLACENLELLTWDQGEANQLPLGGPVAA